jgi:hypothetical protein
MACFLSKRGRLALGFIAYQLLAVAQADVTADEARIREQLASPTRLECKQFPLVEVMSFLADYHDIAIDFDRAEIKRINVDISPRSHVTKTTAGRLDDTLKEILEPFNLSYMIKDGKLLVTSQPKARPWQEKYMADSGRAE